MNKPSVRSIFPPELNFDMVTLKEIEPVFFEFIVRIFNDQEILGRSRTVSDKITIESQKRWYDAYLQRDERYYIILRSFDGIPVGTQSINYLDNKELNIIAARLVFDKKATDNYRQYLFYHAVGYHQFAFGKGINKIYGYVKKGNIAAQKWHHRLGYLKTNEIKYQDYLGEQAEDFEEYVLTEKNFNAAKQEFRRIYLGS